MSKNVKSIFLVATLLFLLVGVSAINASEVSDDNTILQDTDDTVAPEVTTTDKIVDTTTKNIKTEEQTTDLYVSDSSGSDDNSGTNTSPYKTIQKALDVTTADSTYNIHIAEGTYKGLGNTNLTVNGNYYINIIGEGINKTILDGEVNYKIGSGDVWGSDDYWNGYLIDYGNWGLNITTGNGLITISNINIQNMVSPGGANVESYPTATIDNYGVLKVDTVYFYNNLAGVGAGIRNNGGATVVVNNSIFEANRKSSTWGNFGAGLYNNGTCIIDNSIFIGNAARWGTITNDYHLNISNSILKNGISYDLSSTYKMGSGITSNTGNADFNRPYTIEDVITNVFNTTFISNGQTDIYQGSGDLLVDNCNFINSTGIYLESSSNKNQIIQNSNFINMSPSSLFGSLSSKSYTRFAIYGGKNLIINNNTIDFSENGYAIYTSTNGTITNNTITNIIVLDSENTVINNTINTLREYSFNITGRNNIIKNNTIISNVLTGNKAILVRNNANTLENNIPELGTNYILTESNYYDYFDENNYIKTDAIENNSIISLGSDISNKNIIFDNIKIYLTNPMEYTLYNCTFLIKNTSKVVLNGTIINNENVDSDYVLLIESDNTIVKSSTFNITNNEDITAVIIKSNQNELKDNEININSNSQKTTGLLIESDNNEINAMINITNNNANSDVTGIFLNNSNNNLIKRPVTVTGSETTSIYLLNSNNNDFSNTITTNATTRATSVQYDNSHNNSYYSYNITTQAPVNYGINENGSSNNEFIISNMDNKGTTTTAFISSNSQNTTLTTSNYFYKITANGTNIRAIQLINNTNTQISYGQLYTNRNNARDTNITGIDIKDSNNIEILNVTMKVNGTTNIVGTYLVLNNTNDSYISNEKVDTTRPINLIDSNNNTLTQLNMQTNTPTIITLTNSNNNNISNNYLNGNNDLGGNDTITLTNSENNILENNTPTIALLTNDNYNEYFTDNVLNPDTIEITLYSDIYEKDMIFDHPVKINNPNNYTLYNCTITGTYENAIQPIKLFNINMNSTNNKITLISTYRGLTLNWTNIYHENTEDIVQTIKIKENVYDGSSYTSYFYNSTLNSIGQEKTDNITYGIYSDYTMNVTDSKVTVKSNGGSGTVIGLSYGKQSGVVGMSTLRTNLNVTANNKAIGIHNGANPLYSNITVTSYNTTVGIETNKMFTARYNNIFLNGDNITGLYYSTRSSYNNFEYNNMTVNSISNQAIIIETYADSYSLTKAGIRININNITSNVPSIIKIDQNTTDSNRISYNNFDNVKIVLTNGSYEIDNNNITYNENGAVITLNDINPELKIIIPGILEILTGGSTIHDNYLASTDLNGNFAIELINSTSEIYKNTPYTEIIITNDNYDEYFTDGIFTKELVEYLIIGEDLYNKNFTFENLLTILNPNNYTLYNTTISNYNNNTNKKLNLSNVKINNTDYPFSTIISENIILNNCTIYQKTDNIPIITIKNGQSMKFDVVNNTILCEGNNNTIFFINNYQFDSDDFGYNNIYILGDNNTAIYYTNQTSVNFITNNNINIKTNTPTTAVVIDNSRVRFNNNKVTINTTQLDIPIIKVITNTKGQVNNNYIESLDLCGDNAVDTPGTKSGNTPTTIGYYSEIKDVILPEKIFTDIQNNIILNVMDSFGREISGSFILTDEEITTTSKTNIIPYKPTTGGEKTLTITYTDPTGKYNTTTTTININVKELTLTVDPITTTVGETINITARITADDETLTDINKGKVTFKVNGKTIKDANGKVIYAKIVNGIATIENYLIPEDWAKDGSTIEAIYSGSTQCDKLTSEKTEINIEKAEPTLTTSDVTAAAGETITLTAQVTDNNKVINTGKVVFKINGKTVKDVNGKVIYAKVVNNQVSVEYTLPADMKAKEYNITATFISSDYDKLETTATMTIVKS